MSVDLGVILGLQTWFFHQDWLHNMPLLNPNDMSLLIRCPSCSQRFQVSEDLRGRAVECGGCEHRFQIDDKVIVRGRKFYPGERKGPILNRFQRLPMAQEKLAATGAQYANAPAPESFEPPSPLRVIAGLAGVTAMVFMALLLMFGAGRGAILDGMTIQNRLVMVGFTSFLGMVLLVYANPLARVRAFIFGMLLSAGLVSLPFCFTAGSIPMNEGVAEKVIPSPEASLAESVASEDLNLRQLIGTRPLEEEIARLADQESKFKAVGLWFRNLRESNRYLVRDYILRTTRADPQSHFYPRADGDYLMVVTGINQSLGEVAKIATSLGSIEQIYPALHVIEIRVNNESFVRSPVEKLSDKTDPKFYELNKRELESIDMDRVYSAVKRLAGVEPTIYRSDITLQLISLLGQEWVEFKADVCKALAVWSENPGPAGEVALKEALKLRLKRKDVPVEMIALMVKEKTPGLIPVLDELWRENAMRWESYYGDMGPAAEATLISGFSTSEGSHRQSTVRLLGRVGGPDSLPVLEAAANGAESEMAVIIKNAIGSIRERVVP
jgi:predicted Zn finger-like uncharacterized protein